MQITYQLLSTFCFPWFIYKNACIAIASDFLAYTKFFFDRMNIILVPSVGMNYKLMIITTRTGRSEKRRLKKRGKGLQMPFEEGNTCMYRLICVSECFWYSSIDKMSEKCCINQCLLILVITISWSSG